MVQLTAVTMTVNVTHMTAGTSSVLRRDLNESGQRRWRTGAMRYAVPGRRGWSRKYTTSKSSTVDAQDG